MGSLFYSSLLPHDANAWSSLTYKETDPSRGYMTCSKSHTIRVGESGFGTQFDTAPHCRRNMILFNVTKN